MIITQHEFHDDEEKISATAEGSKGQHVKIWFEIIKCGIVVIAYHSHECCAQCTPVEVRRVINTAAEFLASQYELREKHKQKNQNQ